MKFEYRHKIFELEGASTDDHIYKAVSVNKIFYEIDLLEYMLSIKKYFYQDQTISIDVGANIGNHSIFFQSFLTEYVIAVEPNPNVHPILEKNLRNNINNYTICKHALGESESAGRIVMPINANNNVGMAQVEQTSFNDGGKIKITTLDMMVEDWYQKHDIEPKISLIKIDVEGMELAVLKGATKILNKYKPHLFIEAVTDIKLNELKQFLMPLGYRMLSKRAATPVYHFSQNSSIGLILKINQLNCCTLPKRIKFKLLSMIRSYNSRITTF